MGPTFSKALCGAAAAGVAALAWTLGAPDTALANRCSYSNGTSDNGPCILMVNDNNRTDIGSREMNVWCHGGPTSRTHKIILRPGNQFVCKGSSLEFQRLQIHCALRCHRYSSCSGKRTYTLHGEGDQEWMNRGACEE